MLKTLTVTKYKFNEDTNTFTGKEVTVKYSPETGVERIVSINAVQKGSEWKIDITMSDVDDLNFDQFVSLFANWDEIYYNTPSDKYFDRAKAIVRHHAQSYRH